MTDKELHKLKKSELVELLFVMREKIDLLEKENLDLKNSLSIAQSNREMLEKILAAVSPNERKGN